MSRPSALGGPHSKQVEHVKHWLGHVEQAYAQLKAWRHELSGKERKGPPALHAAITSLDKQQEWIGSYED
jgi:hypothetical protein